MIQEKSVNTTFKDDNMEVESPSQHHEDSDEDEDDSDDEIEQFAKKLEEERKAEETKLYPFIEKNETVFKRIDRRELKLSTRFCRHLSIFLLPQ